MKKPIKKINNEKIQKFENFVIFQTENGKVNVEVFFQNNTLQLSQKTIAELFEKGRSIVTEHLQNIFKSGELDEKVVCREFQHTTQHGAIKGKTKNYLNEEHIKKLNRIITAYLDMAETKAENQEVMNMKDWKNIQSSF